MYITDLRHFLDARGDKGPTRSARVVVDAARHFIAQGGTWEHDEHLQVRLHAAVPGRLACPVYRSFDESRTQLIE